MRFRKADLSHLLRTEKGLFKWSKSGIVLTYYYVPVNLSELFKINPEDVFEILDRISDEDIHRQHLQDIKEVRNLFWLKNIEN